MRKAKIQKELYNSDGETKELMYEHLLLLELHVSGMLELQVHPSFFVMNKQILPPLQTIQECSRANEKIQ